MLKPDILRDRILPTIVAPIIARASFRFSRDYRRGATRFHRAVYWCLSTVCTNIRADIIEEKRLARTLRKYQAR